MTDSFRDHFLISMPHLTDSFFEKTVIYICENDGAGSMGLVINRPLSPAQGKTILQALGIDAGGASSAIKRIYYGGPVQPNVGLVLHSPDYEIEGTIAISGETCLTTSAEIMKDLEAGRGPERFRFTMGYAGWGPDQLEGEIGSGDWLVIPADANFMYEKADHAKWTDAARQFGIEITQISGFGGSA